MKWAIVDSTVQRELHLLLRSMDECSVVAMECTPDRDLPLIQIPVAKMKRSIPLYTKSSRCSVGLTMSFHIQTGEFLHCNNH